MSGLEKKTVLIVTGQSGAGLSTALKCLEDLGYEAFDNFPVFDIETMLARESDTSAHLAFGVDSRTRNFSAGALEEIKAHILQKPDWDIRVVYLSCNPKILHNRFSETRRKHPLAKEGSVAEGIRKEEEMIAPIAHFADILIDTSGLSVHDLKRRLEAELRYIGAGEHKMAINIISFGYKNGAPYNADLVLDVRFLKNPHWVEALRPLTGKDEEVGNHIAQDAIFAPFFKNFSEMVELLIPAYEREGKAYLTIAIGCTGGRHRSVFIAEKLKAFLASKAHSAGVVHRELG